MESFLIILFLLQFGNMPKSSYRQDDSTMLSTHSLSRRSGGQSPYARPHEEVNATVSHGEIGDPEVLGKTTEMIAFEDRTFEANVRLQVRLN